MSQKAIETALRAAPDGLTLKELAAVTHKDIENTRKQLNDLYGVYIDRWQAAPPRSPVAHVAVYALVKVPQDCPMPEAALKTLVGQ